MVRGCVFAAMLLFSISPGWAAPVEVLPIGWSNEGLQGEGGDRLRSEMRDARFVALGEDHGLAGPPEMAIALGTEMRRHGPVAHAVEVGPHTTQTVAAVLDRGGLDGFDRFLDGRPLALPFLSNVEDAALALSFVKAGGTASLWGIDQEFIASPLILMERLAELAPDPGVRARIDAIGQAEASHAAAGTFDKLYLSTATPQDFEALGKDFAASPEAKDTITALAQSAVVYQHNNAGRYLENNEARAALMRRYFLDHLARRPAAASRVLLKMGAYHLGRGTTPTSIYDLGSLLPGLAAAQGQTSLHIAYLPLGGRVRVLKPGGKTATAVEDYADETVAPLLALGGVAADRIGATGHVVIPLTALRHQIANAGKMKELTGFQRFVLLGYDYLVTTRDATPATHFEAWPQ